MIISDKAKERFCTDCKIPIRLFQDPYFADRLKHSNKIQGTSGYCKKIYEENGEYSIDFKCLNSYMMPFVLRYFEREEVTESDKIFYHEGLLAKCIDVPKIELDLDSIYPEQNSVLMMENEIEK